MSGTQEAMSARHECMLKKFLGASISLDDVLPFTADETAESHIFRLTDLMNPRSNTPTDILCRAIILTLLQCAARLFPDQQLSTQISGLIGCANFRAILEMGFEAKFDQVSQQNAMSKVGLEPTSAENWVKNNSLFRSIRRMEANLIWRNSNLLYLLDRLHNKHKALLQNSCVPPRMGESFMFHNYTALVAPLSLLNKTALVTLLPDVFQWGEAEAYNDSTSAAPERVLLAQPPKESQGTDSDGDWLFNIDFTSDTERQAADAYQETLVSGIILEILKVNAKTGIQPKLFGPPPTKAMPGPGAIPVGE
jgi:hypothetical protein